MSFVLRKPVVGSIVQYTNRNGDANAALVLRLHEDASLHLRVFTPYGDDYNVDKVRRSTTSVAAGQWNWPPREES